MLVMIADACHCLLEVLMLEVFNDVNKKYVRKKIQYLSKNKKKFRGRLEGASFPVDDVG